MFEHEKAQMIKTGTKMDRYGLIALSGGYFSNEFGRKRNRRDQEGFI